jgi:hypothetical protein
VLSGGPETNRVCSFLPRARVVLAEIDDKRVTTPIGSGSSFGKKCRYVAGREETSRSANNAIRCEGPKVWT